MSAEHAGEQHTGLPLPINTEWRRREPLLTQRLEQDVAASIECHNSIECHPQNVAFNGENGTLWGVGSDSTAPESNAAASTAGPIAGLRRMDTVVPKAITWLWKGYIPRGKLTVIDGDPGLGKSLITVDLAARVSRGDLMPDGSKGDLGGPAGVLLLCAEDSPEDTIRPRLDAAGADVTRIAVREYILEGNTERTPTLADIYDLERDITICEAGLVLIDPIMAYIPGKVNSHSDQEIRGVLTPLSKLAEKTGAAIVVVRHLNKGGGSSPLYRGGGSIGIIAAVRSGLMVAKDPDDESGSKRVLASVKCNLAAMPPSLAYRIGTTAEGVPYVTWEGTTTHTASALLTTPDEGEGRTARDEAKEFLQELLANGSQPAEDVYKEARRIGIADRTLKRAKSELKIKTTREGYGSGGRFFWELPSAEEASSDEDIPF